MAFNVEQIRKEFPILAQQLESGRELVYFDNAATAQKPKSVIDAVSNFYLRDNANIHRSAHELAGRATMGYEGAREKVLKFFNAPKGYTAIFTRGATESLNLVASSWGRANLKVGDEILISKMEHHANIVPWQQIAMQTGAKLSVVDILPDGTLSMDDFVKKLSSKTKIVSITHASNVLGTINDVETITQMAHTVGAIVSIDAAQSSPHLLDDVSKIGCDFLSFSGHKCFAPTGIGVLIAKEEILNAMPPYQTGGDMIENVSFEKTTFRVAPERFEAGTPHIAGAIGLSAAIDWLSGIDIIEARKHEHNLLQILTEGILSISGASIFGMAENKTAVVSFAIEGVHPNDIASLLDADGIAIRTGHHCAEPLVLSTGKKSIARASLSFYNTEAEVRKFIDVLSRSVALLR